MEPVARILIVDDHEMLRRGLRALLSGDARWVVCGEGENGKVGVEKVRQLAPDLVILDVTMPVMNGLDAAREIRQFAPSIKILVFSMHDSPAMRTEFRRVGADAFVLKSAAATELTAMVERLLLSDKTNSVETR
jgi:DNA-binding NarL/FixJ family response regulator